MKVGVASLVISPGPSVIVVSGIAASTLNVTGCDASLSLPARSFVFAVIVWVPSG